MKKLIFLWVLLSSLLRGTASTYAASNFQKKLSCKVTENAVRVYLVQESETLKCQEYLTVINSYLKTAYQDLTQIMNNLNRWDDRSYRSSLYESKKKLFLKLASQKNMIQGAMEDFENELLSKSKLFLQNTLLEKQQGLQTAISETEKELAQSSGNTFNLEKTLSELTLKLEMINLLLTADSMDTFMKNFESYLTLFPLPEVWK